MTNMSESILNALTHLFALIANLNEDGVSPRARVIFENYLRQHLSKQSVDEYLELFDNYLRFHHNEVWENDTERRFKRGSSNSLKVLKICQQINEALHQKEKIVVMLRLIEFAHEDEVLIHHEYDFLKTVSDTFNISTEEFKNLKYFVINQNGEGIDPEHVLVIDNSEIEQSSEGAWFEKNRPLSVSGKKHIYNENLDGNIVVLHISSINIFLMRYNGNAKLSASGHDIQPNRTYVIDNGAIIRGKRIKPLYYSTIAGIFLQPLTQANITLTGENVQFYFKNSRNGIQPFNFSEEAGQLIGIMGGSGVGKSTLFNLLNGKIKPTAGHIRINGHDLHSNNPELKGIIGFVPQDDLLIEELTVYQNLYYNAKLCFRNFNEEQIHDALERMLRDLDLYDIKNLTVGNPLNKFISGGQRKRLNIALELIREPYILFVDEPTSGLSSVDSEMVMLLLKQQTLKGKLVIVNIHQPSSAIFKLFDKLWIIDKGGYMIFNGNPIDGIEYFKKMSLQVNPEESECGTCGNVNPEQILQIVEAKEVDEFGRFTHQRRVKPLEWFNMYIENIQSKTKLRYHTEGLPRNFFKVPGKDKQLRIFFIRNLLSKLTNRQYILINLLEAPILAFVLAFFTKYTENTDYIFADNKNLPIFLFMSVVVALFMGLTVSAEEIIKDRKILERERFLNLSHASYLHSKILYLLLLSGLQTLSFVAVGHYVLEIQGIWLQHWLVLFSASACSNMIGLNKSSAFNSVITIYILIPFVLVPQLLFGGVMVSFDELHNIITNRRYVPFIGDLMPSRWAYEAIAVEQFKNNRFERHFFHYDQQKSEAQYRGSYLVAELEGKLSKCQINRTQSINEAETQRFLTILYNELYEMQEIVPDIPFGYLHLLNAKDFDKDVANNTAKYLENLKTHFRNITDRATQQRDSVYNQMLADFGSDEVQKLQRDNHNKRLADMVLNKLVLSKIYETPDRLICKKDPIFMFPESHFGRAHFYAPVKRINHYTIDTYWFNIAALWLFSLLLYIALRMELLSKAVSYIETLRIRRRIEQGK